MRQDLVKLIETQEDVTNAIILTHNIDFVFLQLIVLSALRRCGRPTLTVFADAHCAAETFRLPVAGPKHARHSLPSGARCHGTRIQVPPQGTPAFRSHQGESVDR